MDRLSNELLKPMVFPAFPRLDEINDFFKGLSVEFLKNGTYLLCQIIGAITKNSDICDFPKTLEATDVNNECIYRAGILTADVALMISGVIMTVLGISSIIGGSVTSVGGIAATGTGVGALVGIPTIVVSSGVVVSGVVQSVSGVSLVYSSVKSFSGDLDELNRCKETAKDFEERISRLDPNDRSVAIKEKSRQVAKDKGLEKDRKLSKRYNRDVYQDPKTKDYYSLDERHVRFEHLNKRGKHLEEVDFDFNRTKPADLSGGHDVNVK